MVRKTSKSKKPSVAPGVLSHIGKTFEMVFRNPSLFFPLFIVGTVFCALTIDISDVTSVTFGLIAFLVVWLTTIFILRHLVADKQITFQDALYNSTTSAIPTTIVLTVAVVQCTPIVIVAILLDTAIETDVFATFGYGLVFAALAIAMLLATLYWLTSTLIALTAVSVPGLYPFTAISKARNLVRGQRGAIVVRLVTLFVMLGLFVAVIMAPVYLWRQEISPIVAAALAGAAITFATIYAATYLYLYYKWLLGAKNDKK